MASRGRDKCGGDEKESKDSQVGNQVDNQVERRRSRRNQWRDREKKKQKPCRGNNGRCCH